MNGTDGKSAAADANDADKTRVADAGDNPHADKTRADGGFGALARRAAANPYLKKAAYIACGVALAAFVIAELLGAAVFSTAFSRSFYTRRFKDNGVESNNHLNLNSEQLDYVMGDLLRYLRGDGREYIDTSVEIGGARAYVFMRGGGLFDPGEKGDDGVQVRHLKDVRDIFTLIRALMLVGAAVIPLAVFAMIKLRKSRDFRRFVRFSLYGLGAFLLIVAAWAAIDFNGIFTLFHRAVFSNDDWLLYRDDLLIEMLPAGLFMNLAFRIIAVFAAFLSVLSAAVFIGNSERFGRRKAK